MAEYGREQRNQLSRVIANNGEVSRQLKGFVDNRSQTVRCRNIQCKADQTSNSGYVIQQSKKGMGLGGLIGAGIGALGFLANPILGSVLLSAGALAGMISGHCLTRNQTEISSENQRLLPNMDAQKVEILQEITLREDKVGEASQSITYPSVTSCMTVTLILVDGNKIGGHFALDGTLALDMIHQMNQIRRGRRVTSVVAKGHGTIWGENLENSDELRSKIRDAFLDEHPSEDFGNIDWRVYAEYQSRFVLVNKQDEFKNWIAAQFGGVDEVEFQNVEDGDVIIL